MIELKDIPGYPGYIASSDGNVYSLHTILKRVGHMGPYGYYVVTLFKSKRPKIVALHILVCTAFHGPKKCPSHQVRHLNGDKMDNRPSNLCWGTRQENEADKKRHGTCNSGERNPRAKLNRNDVIALRNMRASGHTYKACATAFGVSQTLARLIVHKEIWQEITD